MGGIDPSVITHKLNISPTFKPVKQKRRSFTTERQKVINEEVNKLLQAKAIREVEYPDWLANVVLIKKEMENGAFALTSPMSIEPIQKIAFPYLGSTL